MIYISEKSVVRIEDEPSARMDGWMAIACVDIN